MGKTRSFKDELPFEQRLKESTDMLAKYPDRVPVIAEKYPRTDLPELEKKKFLVPKDMSVGHFIHILSSRLQLAPGKALFIFVKDTLPQTCMHKFTVLEIAFIWYFIPRFRRRQLSDPVLLCAACLMDSVYESYKDDDGFLYMCYSTEKTFGGVC
ncbi:hypothetical protein Cgig2_019330 [Carnegiea gigantea]|uniref:Autophagy-related protein n=1 Tax=Carnegiea gigantea TaxID=171969 RepID=A0A9Q1KNE3_9CARY|nr:hypothetical protein Cgig2_019330 [Carnegiea gigantea]